MKCAKKKKKGRKIEWEKYNERAAQGDEKHEKGQGEVLTCFEFRRSLGVRIAILRRVEDGERGGGR